MRLSGSTAYAAYLPRLHRAAQQRAEHVGELIVDEIRTSSATPEETSLLANSFRAVPEPGTINALVVTSAPYWKYVEYGARGRAPQPFVRSAIEAVAAGLR